MAQIPTPNVYFIVTSGGRAASYWLSHLLNQSDDIFCMHGYYPVADLPPGEKNAPDDFDQPGYEIGDVSQMDGSARSDAEWRQLMQERWERFEALTIDEYFDTMKAAHTVKVYGNVHGFTYDTFIRRVKAHPPGHSIRYVNLTRHPVSRAESFYRRFMATAKWVTYAGHAFDSRKAQARPLRDAALARFGVDIYDDDKWLFPDTILRMLMQYGEATVENFPQVKSEDITADKALFRELFTTLTDGRVELTEAMLDDANFGRRLNRTQSAPTTPADQYAAWEPWQRFVFTGMIPDEWLQAYGRIGYDVSFIGRDT